MAPGEATGSMGSKAPTEHGADSPLPDEIYRASLDCVHCGMCLPVCPTYRATGRETSSPRGRVYLMRGIAEGRVPLGDLLAEEAHLCLGCRACETACPSGVEYGAMLELAREQVDLAGLREGWLPWFERKLLRGVVPNRSRLRALIGLIAFAQRMRLDRLALRLLPQSLANAHALLPPIPVRADRQPLPQRVEAVGERRGRVALFEGCVMPELFGPVNRATARVLARNGFEVLVPTEQGCCGALQAHSGDLEFARDLARHNAEVFAPLEVDAIVVNSAGCGAAMREADRWIGDTGSRYAGQVRDVCEFLDEVGLRAPEGRIEARVCYDDPCHLLHGQRVEAAPRRILESIPGIELIDHGEPGACCGAAGTYNLTQPDMSRQVLARKMDALEAADPDIIATGNPGCLMQLRGGAQIRSMEVRVVHPIELLDEAYGGIRLGA